MILDIEIQKMMEIYSFASLSKVKYFIYIKHILNLEANR